MVCTNRYSRDFHSFFSRSRSAAGAGTDDDVRGGRRDAGLVYEVNAARGGARLQLRVPASAQETMAANFRAHLARGNTDYLPAAALQSRLCHASRWLVRTKPSR